MSRNNVRRYPRVAVTFPVDITLGDKTFRGRASTLSGGGLFLRNLQDIAVGTVVPIHFRPAKHLPVMEAKARVCYHLPDQGTALEFAEIQPDHRQLLLRLIHHKTGDKRRHPRVLLATQIECQECVSLAFSRDVSLGGLFIETSELLPVDTEVNLRFHLDSDDPVVIALGRVCYHVPKLGMGIEFVEISPADCKRIEAYIARSPILPDPAPVQTSRR